MNHFDDLMGFAQHVAYEEMLDPDRLVEDFKQRADELLARINATKGD